MKIDGDMRIKIGAVLAALALLVFVVIIVFNGPKKEEIAASDIGIKEISGNTVEERLAKYVDAGNARITKIEDAGQIRQQYSAIFKDAKDGDYLVELPDRVLVYDFEHDRIIAEFFLQNVDFGEGFVE